jgi:spermidine synthase
MANESLNLWLEELYNDQVGLRLRLRECLFSVTSPFQRIAVYESQAFGKVITLGGAIALTEFDEPLYSECLVHPALATVASAARVLILGGGDGGVAREVLRHPGVQHVTVVEIDRQVVEVCKKYFPRAAAGLADPRVELVIDDAHRYLRDCPHQFDVVIVDACELASPSSDAFHDIGFASLVFKRLRDGGVLVAPLGCPTFEAESCRTTLRKLGEKFPKPQVYLMTIPSFPGGQWAVAWCSQGQNATAVAPRAVGGDLRCWHPGLQAAMFALPRNVLQQLGLALEPVRK